MKYIILTALIATALLINFSVSDEVTYQKEQLAKWERDVNNIKPVYKGKNRNGAIYIGYFGEDYYYPKGIDKLIKYEQYILAQEKYYRGS